MPFAGLENPSGQPTIFFSCYASQIKRVYPSASYVNSLPNRFISPYLFLQAPIGFSHHIDKNFKNAIRTYSSSTGVSSKTYHNPDLDKETIVIENSQKQGVYIVG